MGFVMKRHTFFLPATVNVCVCVFHGGKKEGVGWVVGSSWRSPACPGLLKSMCHRLKSNCLKILQSNKFISTGGQFEI